MLVKIKHWNKTYIFTMNQNSTIENVKYKLLDEFNVSYCKENIKHLTLLINHKILNNEEILDNLEDLNNYDLNLIVKPFICI
jgi:hypothetical protein